MTMSLRDEAGRDESSDAPHLTLEGFEGPMDLLLDLARTQRVDLAQISILALVEQYLGVVAHAHAMRLELAGEWLVMAAWLTWLKSRLLLPPETETEEQEKCDALEQLHARLHELEQTRRLAGWLNSRPQLGRDVFSRAYIEVPQIETEHYLKLTVTHLVSAYLSIVRRRARRATYLPRTRTSWSVPQALEALAKLLNIKNRTQWQRLDYVLPKSFRLSLRALKGARASALVAALEMARSGQVALRQENLFDEIYVRARPSKEKP